MSAVALDRQYRWWPNLQESTFLQPPAPLPRPPYSLNCPQQPMQSLTAALITSPHNSDSSSLETLPIQNPFTHAHNPYYTSLTSLTPSHALLHKQPSAQSRKEEYKDNNLTGQVKPCPIPTLRMHAQATSGSLAVSTIEDIVTSRKPTPQVLPEEPGCAIISHPAPAPRGPTSASVTSPLLPPQVGESLTNAAGTTTTTTTTTTSVANFGAGGVTESSGSSDENQSSCCWTTKTYSKCSSRGSVAAKSKGITRRRLLDEEGFIRRAACVCVNEEETQVLLVSSKKDPCVWLVPGGGLEAGEDAVTAAKREAWEEAGIQGHIARYLGLFETCHHSGLKKHRTAVYIFIVTEEHADFPEARLGRRRQWFSMEEALLHLARHRPLQSAYLQLLMMSRLKVAAAS